MRRCGTTSASRWVLTTSSGDTISAQFYIMASGCLSHSKLPEIPGVETFEGPTYHTGHWPHEGVDFTGKRVGVIGPARPASSRSRSSPSRPPN